MASPNPLFRRWPSLIGRLPQISLGSWPTPVEPLDPFFADGRGDVWIKREDLSSSHYGGNKVRKLEFLLAGSDKAIVTFGATGSHHVLATAIHGRRCGRPCIGLLVPQPHSEHHERVNKLIRQLCAATIPLSFSGRSAVESFPGPLRLAALLKKGAQVIVPGASSPRGTLGYVAAGIELAEQIEEGLCPKPSRIYLPLGTGGTAAGLALGLGLMGVQTEIRAVRVASPLTGNSTFLQWLARATFQLLKKSGMEKSMPHLNISIEHNFIGDGYGHVTASAEEAVHLADGFRLSLETTYTGKTMAALLADRKAGELKGPTMLLNTYGPIEQIANLTDCGGENPK